MTTSLVRSAGAGLTTKTASTLIILENEDGETDLRILAQLNAFVTNLQGQINSLSNSLAATQGQVTTNTANITSLSNQLATLQGQYTTLSNQLANIPTGLATQSQVNDLQAQLNAQNTKFSNRTSGLLGGNLWNDVISFGGMGMGIFNTGNTFLNNGRSPFGGGNGATVPDAEARPGYYDR
ncbi:MAG: hypothetical protein SFY92_00750 [Verrucomicrobiae bacterium]|nr:hypothetical protein [Verrucomicrobiae bacterium]